MLVDAPRGSCYDALPFILEWGHDIPNWPWVVGSWIEGPEPMRNGTRMGLELIPA